MKLSARIIAAAVLAAAWLAPRPASACKYMLVPPNEAAAAATAVFEGRVIEVAEEPGEPMPRKRVTLRVMRAWKGAQAERAVLTTATESAACGVEFAAEQNYLVYASMQDGALHATTCSRTRLSSEAEEDFAALGMGWTPVDPTTKDSAIKPAKKDEPPAQGGCAGCAVASERPSTAAAFWLTAAALLLARVTCRRRSGSRS